MPRGPNGEKRPADAIGCAVMVGQIATGDLEEQVSSMRVERARAGGMARMRALSEQERSEIGRRAAVARWSDKEASMENSDCATLAALYQRKAAAGLLDAKFLLADITDQTTEEVCGHILAFQREIEDGRLDPLDFGDFRWIEVPASGD